MSTAHPNSVARSAVTRSRSCSSRLRRCMVLGLVAACTTTRVDGAYFYVKEGSERCFHETVAEHQVLTAKFKNIDNPGVPCSVLFKDERKRVVFSKMVDPSEKAGKTAYMTQRKGEHQICLACTGSKWFSKTSLKWELSVDVGDTDLVTAPATKGDMDGITRAAGAALARIDAISAEIEYERNAENEFRDVSEGVNSRVVFCTLLVIMIEAALCTWQISSLKSYFQAQKLIG